jgi:hypothetical protein
VETLKAKDYPIPKEIEDLLNNTFDD